VDGRQSSLVFRMLTGDCPNWFRSNTVVGNGVWLTAPMEMSMPNGLTRDCCKGEALRRPCDAIVVERPTHSGTVSRLVPGLIDGGPHRTARYPLSTARCIPRIVRIRDHAAIDPTTPVQRLPAGLQWLFEHSNTTLASVPEADNRNDCICTWIDYRCSNIVPFAGRRLEGPGSKSRPSVARRFAGRIPRLFRAGSWCAGRPRSAGSSCVPGLAPGRSPQRHHLLNSR